MTKKVVSNECRLNRKGRKIAVTDKAIALEIKEATLACLKRKEMGERKMLIEKADADSVA